MEAKCEKTSICQHNKKAQINKMKLSERQMIKKKIISKTALHIAVTKFKNEDTFADRKRTWHSRSSQDFWQPI